MKRPALAIAMTALMAIGSAAARAEGVSVEIFEATGTGPGQKLGTVVISPKDKGVVFDIDVKGIAAGDHGFHVHEKDSCAAALKDGKAVPALGAGPHFDPTGAKTHAGPHGKGHKGDLPFITATADGVKSSISAPNLTLAEIEGRSLVIHQNPDNYTDHPENGGSGPRIACGVIPKKDAK